MLNFEIIKFLILSIVLFLIGILGIFLIKKNIIIILMSIELMLLAININFIIFSIYINDITGQIFGLFILTVAAAESAIGLAILVIYYRIKGIISINFINSIKG
jgi:NADH-quinone oxidoreductase subunit K